MGHLPFTMTSKTLALSAAASLAIIVLFAADASGALVRDTFTDDNGNVHESNIETIAAVGVTKGCNPPANTRFCPSSSVTRAQMAVFLDRALDWPATNRDYFIDDTGSVYEPSINRMAAAGITTGCNPDEGGTRFCPNGKVTREQMAAFLVRALGYTKATGGDRFTDDDASIFEADINRLATAGVTLGCNPPSNSRFCPRSLVRRDQMASFLTRAIDFDAVPPAAPPPSTTVPPPTTTVPPPTTTVPPPRPRCHPPRPRSLLPPAACGVLSRERPGSGS